MRRNLLSRNTEAAARTEEAGAVFTAAEEVEGTSVGARAAAVEARTEEAGAVLTVEEEGASVGARAAAVEGISVAERVPAAAHAGAVDRVRAALVLALA